jgi:RNA-directed DNA polymerase
VHDSATLVVAFDRVVGNTGARTAGVDGVTVADVEQQMGVPGFLDDLRAQLKAGHLPAAPGAGAHDSQAGWIGQGQKPRYSDGG